MPRIAVLPILVATVATIALGSYTTLAGPGPIVDFVPQSGGSNQAQDGQDSGGADSVAQAIADEFGVTKDEVLTRHNEGIGFGALFKLYKLARARSISIDELLTTMPVGENGQREFRFGQLRKALTAEQRALYESGPKNLGKLVSATNKKEKTGAEGEGKNAKPGHSRGNGRIPPGQAKKHGR